ncbi:MAG: lysylphosphatidylglycerol synthase transmembrane domain-containing protein [Candidatus Bathyarchaeia archaeon]
MKKSSPIKLIVSLAAGLIIFILYLHFFVGFEEIIGVFKSVDPREYLLYYSITIMAMILSMLFYSMSWRELMKALSINLSIRNALFYSWVGIFVDLVIPLESISGEITRIYLVHRETRVSSGKIIASVVAHRIITTSITLGSLIFASALIILKYEVSTEALSLLLAVLLGSIFLIASLIYLSLKEGAVERLLGLPIKAIAFIFRGRINPLDLRDKVQRNLAHFYDGFKIFSRSWGALTRSAAYNFIAWLLHMSIYLLVFYALGFGEILQKINETIIVYSISVAVQTIPVALPLGLVEIVMTSLYTLFKIPIALSGTATLLIRIITFWLQILVGYAIAQWIGVKNLLSRNQKETSG